VKDIRPGPGSSLPAGLVDVNGVLFFAANDGTAGTELWRSDGTAAGTTLVKDIRPGGAGSAPANLTNVNGTLFFAANDGTQEAAPGVRSLTDLAVFRQSTGQWLIFGSVTGFPGPVLFGAPGLGDIPVPADYDGDGKADLAVYRASTAEYFIFGSESGFPGPIPFGAPGLGDLPLNRPAALR
jgi:ELWxxDGT repeat protein